MRFPKEGLPDERCLYKLPVWKMTTLFGAVVENGLLPAM
jgi:hypothetical protein